MMTHVKPLLDSLCQIHTIPQNLVVCYGKQVLMYALWLHQGEIIVDKGKGLITHHTEPGPYFYEEFLSGKTLSYKIEVTAGSQIWILTKSELALSGIALPA